MAKRLCREISAFRSEVTFAAKVALTTERTLEQIAKTFFGRDRTAKHQLLSEDQIEAQCSTR